MTPDKTVQDSKLEELEEQIVGNEVEMRDEYMEFLVEEGMEREKLEDLSVNDLKTLYMSKKDVSDIEEEMSERQKLIHWLSEEGFSTEMLEKSSTTDLRHVWERVNQDDIDDRTLEKFERDARKDFSSIMIDVNSLLKDDEERKVSDRISNLVTNLSKRFKLSSENGGNNIRKYNMKRIFETYSELPPVEGFVKACYVMKSYLEFGMEAVKKMDYQEVTNYIPDDRKELETVSEAFLVRHERDFSDVDEKYVEEVLDDFVDVLDHLHFSER